MLPVDREVKRENSDLAVFRRCQWTDWHIDRKLVAISLHCPPRSTLISGWTYYLRFHTYDNVGNVPAATQAFVYKFDNTPPNNPAVTG